MGMFEKISTATKSRGENVSIATNTALMTALLGKYSTGHVSVRERAISNNLVTLVSSTNNTDTALVAVVGQFTKGEVDGSLILSTDIKITVDATKAISKSDGDQVLIAGVAYRIVNVREISPVGTLLGYVLQCRK